MKRSEFLLFSPPLIGDDEIREVVDTLRSNWITTGPKTRRFEEVFAARVQAPGALALNSCTAGLHTALLAAGVGPGAEVITTPLTFAASANVIEHVGARPVLADVEPDTLNIDPGRIEAVLSPRTRAVIPVHYAGHPADLDALWNLEPVRSGAAVLIEDAAHALPATYRGRPIGAGANPAAFSFYATKNLTTGEGGMLTAAPDFLERARVISLHGMSRDAWQRYDRRGSWAYDVGLPGFKYNMSDIQASLGLGQLARLDQMQARRRAIAAAYHEAFSQSEVLEPPVARAEVGHAWHLYVLRLRRERLRIDRDAFIEEMRARNIGTSVHFIPIHLHSYYRDKYGFAPADFPVALDAFTRMASLPINPKMTDEDVADVIAAVMDIVARHRR